MNSQNPKIDGEEDWEKLVENLEELSRYGLIWIYRVYSIFCQVLENFRAPRVVAVAIALYAAHICENENHHGCLQKDHCLSEENYLKMLSYIFFENGESDSEPTAKKARVEEDGGAGSHY